MTGLDGASIQFIGFGLLVAAVSNLSRARNWRLAVLLAASFGFIALLGPGLIGVLPFTAFLFLGYASIAAIRRDLPQVQIAAVTAIVVAYIWLKQYSFLPASVFLQFPYFTLGLSYIFFRILHLVIEAARAGPAREIRAPHYLAYTLNFTTLISGPIQRYEDFSREQNAREPAALSPPIIGAQIERLIRGFFKVNVLGLLFSMVQADALAELNQPVAEADKIFAIWRIVASYPLFLYCNFSGYIDIVIAIARLMRIPLPENFDRPFSATSFIDFWNRWHITLSSWLKTYVYNPLLIALMRRNPSAALEPIFGILCFFVTFFLIGIWHGRTSEYAFFGVLQGGGVALNKLWQVIMIRRLGRKPYRQLAARPVYVAGARGLTYSWFALSLVWFWASWSQIHTAYDAIGGTGWLMVLAGLLVVATIVLTTWEAVRPRLLAVSVNGVPLLTSRYMRAMFATILFLIAFLIVAVLSQPAPGIVYRTF